VRWVPRRGHELGARSRGRTQVELAKSMCTSRTVVAPLHRLLDPHDTSVMLATLSKASEA